MPRHAKATPAQRSLGARLRQARLAVNITQAEVAKDLFSVSYVSAVERDMIRPSLGALDKLAERLNIPVADLLRDEDDTAGTGSGGEVEDKETLLREAQIYLRRGEPARCVAILEPLLDKGLSLRESATAYYALASALAATYDFARAQEAAKESIAVSERLGDAEARERARLLLGTILTNEGHLDSAIVQLRAVQDVFDSGLVHDPVTKLRLLVQLGTALRLVGRAEESAEQLRFAATDATQIDEPTQLSEVYAKLAAHANAQGDTRLARQFASRSLAALDEADRRQVVGQAYAQHGRSLAEGGELDAAEEALGRALSRAQEGHDTVGTSMAHVALSDVWLRRGDLAHAAHHAQLAIEAADTTREPLSRAEALASMARVENEQRKTEQAHGHFEAAIALLQEAHAEARLSDLYAEFSSILERQGQSQRALEMLREAWHLRGSVGR